MQRDSGITPNFTDISNALDETDIFSTLDVLDAAHVATKETVHAAFNYQASAPILTLMNATGVFGEDAAANSELFEDLILVCKFITPHPAAADEFAALTDHMHALADQNLLTAKVCHGIFGEIRAGASHMLFKPVMAEGVASPAADPAVEQPDDHDLNMRNL